MNYLTSRNLLAFSAVAALCGTACGGGTASPTPSDTQTPIGDPTSSPSSEVTPTAEPAVTPTMTPTVTPTVTPTATPAPPPNPWSIAAHPCFGNRTDALWFDNKTDGWVGCGSTTEGYGLYATRDGGKTWKKPTTNPAGFFDAYRVNTISRSEDGLLYVGGQVSSGYNVVKLETSSSTLAVTEVFLKGNQSWNSFQVGGFRRLADGQALAESLTGNGIAYRASDSAAWEDATKWYEPDPSNHQFLDLVSYNGDFFGCGSTISEPPMVFLPPKGTPKYPYSFSVVLLASGISDYNGEMWGLTADAEGVAVVGIDQDRDVGKVYVSLADPYTTSGWRSYDLASTFPEDPTWARGVCRGGGRLVVVGEFQKLGEGFVLVSEDGGQTFLDLTPPTQGTDEIPALHKCVAFPDGDFVVAGASGFVGFYHDAP